MSRRRRTNGHDGGSPVWMLDLMFLTIGALSWLLFYMILRSRAGGESRLPPELRVSSFSLPTALAGQRYSVQLGAIGGQPYADASGAHYRWELEGSTNGLAQWGLSLNATNGDLSGVPAQPSHSRTNVTFVVRVFDGSEHVSTQALDLQIESQPPSLALEIVRPNDGVLAEGIAGRPFAVAFSARGGRQPYIWSLEGKEFEHYGLKFDQAAGVLSGTRLAFSKTASTSETLSIAVAVADALGKSVKATFTLPIKLMAEAHPIELLTQELPAAVAGDPYSLVLSARYGKPPYVWRVSQLPSGFGCDAGKGLITGASSSPGEYKVHIEVSDSAGIEAAPREPILRIRALSEIEPLHMTMASNLPAACSGAPYDLALAAKGGRGQYRWRIVKSDPRLIAFEVTTEGRLRAREVPDAQDEAPKAMSIEVRDADDRTDGATLSLAIVNRGPRPAPLKILSESLPNAFTGDKYRVSLAASGGVPPYRWLLRRLACPDTLRPFVSVDENGLCQAAVPAGSKGGRGTLAIAVSDARGEKDAKDLALNVLPSRTAVVEALSVSDGGVGKWWKYLIFGGILACYYVIKAVAVDAPHRSAQTGLKNEGMIFIFGKDGWTIGYEPNVPAFKRRELQERCNRMVSGTVFKTWLLRVVALLGVGLASHFYFHWPW